jgi:hypothetical protein
VDNTNDTNNTFSYTYSAKQNEEVKKIRQKYLPREKNKMEQLRMLDKSAEKPGTIVSLIIGVIGVLLFGVGLTCTLELTDYFTVGVIVGAIGVISISLTYPIYSFITKKQRDKLAPQIIKLSDELIRQ